MNFRAFRPHPAIIGRIPAVMAVAWILLTGSLPASAENEPTVDLAISRAESALEKAAAAGGEWRDTGMLLKNAKAASTKGDLAEAMRLAEQARVQAELGYQQSLDQQNAGPRF